MAEEAETSEEQDETPPLGLYRVTISRTMFIAAESPDEAWEIGEAHTNPDPNDCEMEDVTGVDEVRGELDADVLKKIPALDGEEHNTLTVTELIEAGLLDV